jgi:uncharacterized protein YceH (UPF0502 family)
VDVTLNAAEARVLGALIEKEITTPDYYPLSLNALTAACNQTSNREPVMQLDETAVAEAADGLRDKKLVHVVNRDGSRVLKYRHVAYEVLNLGRPAIAVLCLLLLRGHQTAGELRTRSGRLYDFTSLEEVELVLNSLMSGDPPRVARLARRPGQKEVRYAHLFSGDVATEPEPVSVADPNGGHEDRIARLEREVEELKRQFEHFRKQFE